MQKITPFLWFDSEAEEAANYYVSIFSAKEGAAAGGKKSKVGKILRYDEASAKASGRPVGSILTVEFELEGQKLVALNGGPFFQFSGAISFVVNCQSQEEIDYFWEKLSEGGEEGQCGWINRDKFGVTWQVTPTILIQYLNDPDPEKSKRVMQAMLKMNKIIIEDVEKAYEQE